MKRLRLNSYAKLNLYLEVLETRKDGYHNIKTIFERIDLADKITLRARPDKKINITCNRSGVPQGRANLVWQSARLLQDSFNMDKGADIKIIKRIPVGSGLGGGSSNAAAVLTGLNKLWKLNLTRNKLAGLAAKLGCDVPFFIYNGPFAQGEARGDKIKPLKALNSARLWHILVVPKLEVSTASIYKKWDKYAGLTRPRQNVTILLSALKKNNFFLLGNALFNSLEQVSARLYPQINAIKEKLRRSGARAILMSGSGPAVMAIAPSRKEAISLSRKLKKNSSWQVFVTRTQ